MKKKITFPTVVQPWKKFLIVGCSHGQLADPAALNAVLAFKRHYEPHKTIHLGDFIDTSAWRSGAKGSADEAESVADDVEAGLVFLDQLRPNLVFNGNHEHRLWKHAQKPNAIIAHSAAVTISHLSGFIEGELKAEYVKDYVLEKSWRWLGNYLIGHGFFYNMHAVKKHADRMGNSIFAHLHRQEIARGDRSDRPTGVCIGYLGQRDKFTYADLWESRFRWDTGWCFGEYTDSDCNWQLHRHIANPLAGNNFPRV